MGTIADFESRTRVPIRATLAAIQRALEAAGVGFLPDHGVRLRAADPMPIRNPKPGGGTAEKPSGKSAKPTRSSPRRTPKAAPMSKEAQLRALREQAAR